VTLVYADPPPGNVGEHYRAVGNLVPAGLTVYYGGVPTQPTYPYVVLWGDLGDEVSGDAAGDALDDVVRGLSLRIRATCVAANWDSLMITVARVRGALNRAKPYVAHWSVSKLKQSALLDAQPDADVTIPGTKNHPYYAVDEYALVSERTA
jgi:hypothetical protein